MGLDGVEQVKGSGLLLGVEAVAIVDEPDPHGRIVLEAARRAVRSEQPARDASGGVGSITIDADKITLIGGDALVTQEYWQITGEAGAGTLMTFSPDPRKSPSAAEVVSRW